MKKQNMCCEFLSDSFQFYYDIRTALPPKGSGVYIIRVKKVGEKNIAEIVTRVNTLLETLNWQSVGSHILNRIERLNNVDECSTIYIGSGVNLNKRYKDFSGHHTIMHCLWALIYFGWELEFGWKETEDHKKAEKELKESYKDLHNGKLPALVKR